MTHFAIKDLSKVNSDNEKFVKQSQSARPRLSLVTYDCDLTCIDTVRAVAVLRI